MSRGNTIREQRNKLWYPGFIPGIVIAVLIGVGTQYFENKVNKIKKQYDVQTYREIVAFTKRGNP